MNLEGNWSLATPLTGLGCARSYYENFSAKFMNFLYQIEIPFVDKSIDKNDKSPPTNLSTKRERQKRQKYRVQFIDFTSFCAVECIWWVTRLVCIAINTFLIENSVLQITKYYYSV